MAELKKDGIRAIMSEEVERETLKRMGQLQAEKREPVLWYHMLPRGWDCPVTMIATNHHHVSEQNMSADQLQGERLLPCPLFGHLPDKGEFTNGPYIAVSGAPGMPKFYAVVCPGCCSTAYDENKERVIKKWNTRRAAVAEPRGDARKLARKIIDAVINSPCVVEVRMFSQPDAVEKLEDAIIALLPAATASPAPAESGRAAGEQLAIEIIGTVFDNTGASHETLKAAMIERITDWLHRAPSDSARRAAEEIQAWANEQVSHVVTGNVVEVDDIAAIISKHFGINDVENVSEPTPDLQD